MVLNIKLCKANDIYWDDFPWLSNIESIYCITSNGCDANVIETKCSFSLRLPRGPADWEQLIQYGV